MESRAKVAEGWLMYRYLERRLGSIYHENNVISNCILKTRAAKQLSVKVSLSFQRHRYNVIQGKTPRNQPWRNPNNKRLSQLILRGIISHLATADFLFELVPCELLIVLEVFLYVDFELDHVV